MHRQQGFHPYTHRPETTTTQGRGNDIHGGTEIRHILNIHVHMSITAVHYTVCLVNTRVVFTFSVMRGNCPPASTSHHETTPNGHNWHEICKQGRTRRTGTSIEGILHQQTKATSRVTLYCVCWLKVKWDILYRQVRTTCLLPLHGFYMSYKLSNISYRSNKV